MELGDSIPPGREQPQSEPREPLAPTPKEHELSTASITSQRGLVDVEKLNEVTFVTFDSGSAGIFKPAAGEVFQMEKIEPGTYYKRERAGYLVDRAMGYGLVPPTVIREIEGRIGSLQEFIPNTYPAATYPLGGLEDQTYRLWIFDQMIRNNDRNIYNLLFTGGKIHAIDHGLSFANRALRKLVSFNDEKAPPEVIERSRTFLADKPLQNALGEQLATLLSSDETDACLARMVTLSELLTRDGTIAEEVPFHP